MNKKGFTLIELIIVVIIIGILATVAVPQFVKAIERAKGGKARNAMALIAKAEKMVRAETDTYRDVADAALNDAGTTGLGDYIELVEVVADPDWSYDVTGATATTFLITAERTDGPNITETITLDQDGVWVDGFTP